MEHEDCKRRTLVRAQHAAAAVWCVALGFGVRSICKTSRARTTHHATQKVSTTPWHWGESFIFHLPSKSERSGRRQTHNQTHRNEIAPSSDLSAPSGTPVWCAVHHSACNISTRTQPYTMSCVWARPWALLKSCCSTPGENVTEQQCEPRGRFLVQQELAPRAQLLPTSTSASR